MQKKENAVERIKIFPSTKRRLAILCAKAKPKRKTFAELIDDMSHSTSLAKSK